MKRSGRQNPRNVKLILHVQERGGDPEAAPGLHVLLRGRPVSHQGLGQDADGGWERRVATCHHISTTTTTAARLVYSM